MIDRVSFSGIYDIRFPLGTRSEVIEDKCNKIKGFIQENYPSVEDLFLVNTVDKFISTSDKIKPLDQKGIRLVSTVDNPHIIVSILDALSPKLGQDYINKSKVELTLDTTI